MKADGSPMKRPTKGELERALRACCTVAPWGQVCFRTTNGIPMGMPKRTERIVSDVLKRL